MHVENPGREGVDAEDARRKRGGSYVGYARDTLTLELARVELLDSCSEVGGALELNKTRARRG